MLKMTRLAMLATALVLAMPSALAPSVALAQGQPAPAATPATPATPPAAAPTAVAPPAAPAATAAKVGEKTTEIIENPYGLEALWKGGDLVARITLGILVIMSMGSWYVIITKLFEQTRMGVQARSADKTFWKAT